MSCRCLNLPGLDQIRAGARVELGDHLSGARDHQRAQALVAVGAPCLVDRIEHRLCVAVDQSAALLVPVERVSASVPQS